MNPAVVFGFPGQEGLARKLADGMVANDMVATSGEMLLRRFPDGETYVRLDSPVDGHRVILACGLDHPDDRAMGLLFAAATARELGATQVGIVAPYLGYMRQDARFQPGEAVTSRHVARMLSQHADWLLTVDPHLHRYRSLDEIYSIPSVVVPAAPVIAAWITANVARPLLVGPDVESEQWVAEVARLAGAPHVVMTKTRHGDREVEIARSDFSAWGDRTPVLVDDIISTARTMVAAAKRLVEAGLQKPVCIGVHALFAPDALALLETGAAHVATCNTIAHVTNAIDMAPAMIDAVVEVLRRKQA